MYDFAKEVGDVLSDCFKNNISKEILPDGKMYFNIADRILNNSMSKAYEVISNYSTEVQTALNKAASLNIKGVAAEVNQDRIDGLINKMSKADDFEKVEWLLDEPIKNFCRSIVDDTIKTNVTHHHKLGLKPVVKRISSGRCCSWCDKIAGTYNYPDVPKDVYRRHRHCDCIVDYYPGDGRKQDVWSKKWKDIDKSDIIEKRKTIANAKPKTLKKDDISTKKFTRGSGKNYPIRIGNSEHVKFDNEIVESVTVIAGKGTSVDIRDVRRLQNIYNEPEKRWEKTTGITYIRYKNKRLKTEIHWYEANGKRYEIKVRKVFDES